VVRLGSPEDHARDARDLRILAAIAKGRPARAVALENGVRREYVYALCRGASIVPKAPNTRKKMRNWAWR
jgi:hypothetical protein